MQILNNSHMKSISLSKWKPSLELGILLLSWLLVVAGLWLAFQIFTVEKTALNFITFGPVTLFGLGVALPIFWTLNKGRFLSDLGIKREHAVLSIVLGFMLSLFQYFQTIANITLPTYNNLIPLIMMTLSVGLFETIFFRGWLQLRLEDAFGIIPSVILGAAFYAFYHIGYGMTTEEIWFLFSIGLLSAGVFRLTKNALILWPFFTPLGALYTNINNGLFLPFEATYGFMLVLILMLGFLLFVCLRYPEHAFEKKTGPAAGGPTKHVEDTLN